MWLRWWFRHRWSEPRFCARLRRMRASRRASTRPRMPSLEHAEASRISGGSTFLSYVLFPATAYIAVIVTVRSGRMAWFPLALSIPPHFRGKGVKKKGGRREGDVLPPARTRQVGGSLVRSPEAISWGKASGSLTHGKRSKPVKTGFEPPVGIEPTTCRLQGGRSGHLS